MVTNTDLQTWQDAVNGINVSGKTDLTQEEWTALGVLNGCLSSGNFQSQESRRSLDLLKYNLSWHQNNPELQMHLQNFINLCEKYSCSGTSAAPIHSAVQTSAQSANTTGFTPIKARKENYLIDVIVFVAFVFVYATFIDNQWLNKIFSGEGNLLNNLAPLGILFFFYLAVVMAKNLIGVQKNIPRIKNHLEQNGFIISRYVGENLNAKFSMLNTPYSLYVDDVHKLWYLTSPYMPEIGKIRKYDDLIDYETFDTDGFDLVGYIFKGMVTAGSILGGLAISAASYRSLLLGGAIGGLLGSRASRLILGKTGGVSHAYGLLLITKDCDVNHTHFVYDFANANQQALARHSWLIRLLMGFAKLSKHGYRRISGKYRKDFKHIKEMIEIFDYIYRNK